MWRRLVFPVPGGPMNITPGFLGGPALGQRAHGLLDFVPDLDGVDVVLRPGGLPVLVVVCDLDHVVAFQPLHVHGNMVYYRHLSPGNPPARIRGCHLNVAVACNPHARLDYREQKLPGRIPLPEAGELDRPAPSGDAAVSARRQEFAPV
jgi:hypothetical protein